MKKISIFSLLVALLLGGLTGCEDYEDGPGLSFRSKEERAVNTWDVEYAFENELDITKRYENTSIKLDYEGFLTIYTRVDSDSVATQEGFWEFYDEEQNIRFIYTDPPVWPDRDYYQVLRLKEKELWLWDLQDSLGLEIRLMPGDSLPGPSTEG